MATKRRSTPKGRGGSSGGANPKNSREISEQQHEDAMRVLRAEYYSGVRGIVQNLKEALVRGEIDTEDTLNDRVHQDVNGSYWIIYTHANFQVLLCSDHHDAYENNYGEAPVEGSSIKWAALAYAAMEQDVRELMEAEEVRAPLEEAPYVSERAVHEPQRLSNGQLITWHKQRAGRGEYGGYTGRVENGAEYQLNQRGESGPKKFVLYYFSPSGQGPHQMGYYPSLEAAKRAIDTDAVGETHESTHDPRGPRGLRRR